MLFRVASNLLFRGGFFSFFFFFRGVSNPDLSAFHEDCRGKKWLFFKLVSPGWLRYCQTHHGRATEHNSPDFSRNFLERRNKENSKNYGVCCFFFFLHFCNLKCCLVSGLHACMTASQHSLNETTDGVFLALIQVINFRKVEKQPNTASSEHDSSQNQH